MPYIVERKGPETFKNDLKETLNYIFCNLDLFFEIMIYFWNLMEPAKAL